MKKKIFFAIAIIAISTTAIAAYTSFNTTVEKSTKHDFIEETHLECQGKHCTYRESRQGRRGSGRGAVLAQRGACQRNCRALFGQRNRV